MQILNEEMSKKAPPQLAVEKQNVSIVRKLVAVEANASFHGTFYLGYTPLELAVSIQDINITITSVEAGAGVNAP
jgi:hypothetical protein